MRSLFKDIKCAVMEILSYLWKTLGLDTQLNYEEYTDKEEKVNRLDLRPVIKAEEVYGCIVAVTKKEQRYHRETNLYCQVTPETTEVVNRYEYRKTVNVFIHNDFHTKWYMIPFVSPRFGGTYDAE